jgi:hypothetical protein
MTTPLALPVTVSQDAVIVGEMGRVSVGLEVPGVEVGEVVGVGGVACGGGYEGWGCVGAVGGVGLTASAARAAGVLTLVFAFSTPLYVGDSPSYRITLSTSSNYAIGTATFTYKSTTPAALALSVTSNQTFYNELSRFSFSVNTTIPGSTLQIIFPSEFSLSSPFTIQPISGVTTSTTSYPANTRQLTLTVTQSITNFIIDGVLSPRTATGSSWTVTLKDASDRVVAQSSAAGFVSNCELPCRECSASRTTCTSCYSWNLANSVYNSATNTCGSSCPAQQFNDNSLCRACVSPCL